MKKLLIFALIFLTGCASIPDISSVKVISQVDVNADADRVRVIARPPTSSMTAVEIVEGFLAANASLSGNRAVAKQYLTTPAATQWKTENTYIIDAARTSVVLTNANQASLSIGAIGVLHSDSRLSWFDSPQTKLYQISLVKTAAGYRITNSDLPVAMSTKDFFRNYSHFTAYFLNSDYTTLVPDSLWLSATASTGRTQLMIELLKGGSANSQGAIRTAIPAGTELAVAAVTTESGVSNVSLTSQALQLSKQLRKAMLAQIVWTLTELSNSSSVTVSSGGQPMTVDGKTQLSRAALAAFAPDFSKPDLNLFYSDSNGIFRVKNSESTKLTDISNVQQLAISQSGTYLAYIASGLAYLGTTANPASSTLISSAIASVDFDRYNRLWLINQSGQILVKSGTREPVSVSGAPANALSVALAPDGVRLAVVQTSPSGNVLRIYSIVNTATGASLTKAQRIETVFSDVTDVDWVSDSELAVIGRVNGGEVRIYRIGFRSLPPVELGSVTDAVQVMAIQNQPITVLTRQGLLARFVDGTWKNFKTVNSAAYAG